MTLYEKADLYKKKIDELRPFGEPLLSEIREFYRIGLTWSSNALEGNTLTESETKILLEDGLTVGGKPLRCTFEALGHSKAYDFMFSLMNTDKITEENILTLHKMFYSAIDENNAGIYRTKPVIISGSKYPVCNVGKIPDEMKKLVEWIETKRSQYHPIEFAALLHKRFVFIHPFIDGNGRIARLLMNAALIQKGYLPTVIPPVQRLEYIHLLEEAHRNDEKFLSFIAEKVIDSETDFARLVHIELFQSNSSENTFGCSADEDDSEEFEP